MKKTSSSPTKSCPELTEVPNWLPDWRNESEYPDPETTSPKQWVWEFLRRNPDYQKRWKEIIVPYLYRDKDSKVRFDQEAAMKALQDKAKKDPAYKAALAGKGTYITRSPFCVFRQEFGVSLPMSPYEKTAGDFFYPIYQSLSYQTWKSFPRATEEIPENFETSIKAGQILMYFDLRWPLAPQLEKAKIILEREAKAFMPKGSSKKPSHRFSKFREYLRLLDAKQSKPKPRTTDIAAIIYPNVSNSHPECRASKKVVDDYRAAKRLRDCDYRLIETKIQK